jgi:hypothetical protein
MRKKLAVAFIFALLFSVSAWTVWGVAGNPDAGTLLSMPEEQINYTITRVNRTLWAIIDGTYPLHVLTESDGASSCVPSELPMVYPTPPNTTNIHVKVDGAELEWSECPEEDTHHTAIGDWRMVFCLISPVSEDFVLRIHYEHPVEVVNGSYIFLYDLNISPYLSKWSLNSTAYFTIRFDGVVSNLQAFATETDEVWNPIDYTLSQDGDTQVMAIQMYSEYDKPLLGDLVVMFSDEAIPEFPVWIISTLLLIGILFAALGYKKLKVKSR